VLHLEVLDVDALRPERLRDPGQHARPVGDVDAQVVELARVGVGVRQHPPPVSRGLADPACEEARVARLERGLELLDAAAVLAQRVAQLLCVLEEDVHPDPRVGAGHAGHVPQRPAGDGQRLVAFDSRRSGLVHEQVGERVRQVARQRDEPVMGLGIDGDGDGAER